MATLTVYDCSREGVALGLTGAAAAASGGDEWVNTGREVLVVTNGDATPHNVFATVQAEPDGRAVTERTGTVTNGTTKMYGPFPIAEYNDANGRCHITYSAVTSMKVQVVRIPTS